MTLSRFLVAGKRARALNAWLYRWAGRGALIVALTAMASAAYAQTTILVYGDSLSAGYGLERGESWVELMRERLNTADADAEVVNASVSGETSAGGRSRLAGALERHAPDIVLLELGANDGLRALPVSTMRDNLEAMIQASRDAGAQVLLLGMRIPSNYGRDYSERFHQAFVDVADATAVAFVPFFLEPIAADRSMFQDDGIHPNAEAQDALLGIVWPRLADLLSSDVEKPAVP